MVVTAYRQVGNRRRLLALKLTLGKTLLPQLNPDLNPTCGMTAPLLRASAFLPVTVRSLP